MILTANQGDTLDQLLFRQFGKTAGLVEIALEYNPALADDVKLKMGQKVVMPDDEIATTTTQQEMISLWD
ncbi:hypothetical protein A1D22_09520 [Pasteurellaceae bacterium LFhippo2]|nr:hypothetical protein [Pasteurellaceae bacterium LFhippo2]